MNLKHALYLALQHLKGAPARTAVLISGLAIALFLPWFTWEATSVVEASLLSRAQESPILVGRKGDRFDLTMAALYFQGHVRDPVDYGERAALEGRGAVLPLHVSHSADGAPIVGTDVGYFSHRGLDLSSGRTFALLGEVVAGAAVAESFGLSTGDQIRTDTSNLYNLAGAYPYMLTVVGVLEPQGTADDDAFFASLQTAWMLDGAVHGHEAVTEDNALPGDEEGPLEATAAMFMIQELTDTTRASFHLHGSADDLPVSGWIVIPSSVTEHDQLLGDLALHDALQAVRPNLVVQEVLNIVLRVRDLLSAWFGLVALSTLAFFALVLSLSLRLRQRELTLIRRVGGSPQTILTLIGVEITLVVGAAWSTAVLANELALWWLTSFLPGVAGA